MECGYKRKLDTIVDSMEFIGGDELPLFRNPIWENENKKIKLSQELIADSEQFQLLKNLSGSITGNWSQDLNSTDVEGSLFNNDGTSMDNESNEDDMHEEDVPSTAEVINSLRKVILWMSAQVDYKSNHLQYLEEVEQYAISKQLDIAQQRKITQYFFKE